LLPGVLGKDSCVADKKMIIRRRHTKNFTTIGNELFDDERLEADELGILAFLLSRPDDWEIRRPALRRRFRLGDVTTKRIITNLMRAGWCRAEKIRSVETGRFYIDYEICDEPGPELSEEEIKRALSVVSTEAADDASTSSEGDPEQPAPPLCSPGVDSQGVVTGGVAYKSLPNTDSLNPESTKADGVFWSDLQKAWPPDDVLSVLVCEKLFASLSRSDRKQAIEAAEPYIANCRARNRKLCDLSTYLKERRFVGKLASLVSALPVTRPGTPQAARWLESGQLSAFQAQQLSRGYTITTPTEWPKQTGPPVSPHMTAEDEKAI